MKAAKGAAEGLVLTGQFVAAEGAYSFAGREVDPETGEHRQVSMRPAVKLLVGTVLVKVPYDPERVTLAELVGDAAKGDMVSLPVRASGPFDEATRTSAPVKYRVWLPRVAGEADEEGAA